MAGTAYENWGASMPHGVEARFYVECDSTNTLARSTLVEIGRTPTWFAAGIQTSGRGRQGRTWVSDSGNLYSTLVFKPNLKPADLKALPYILSLAVRDAFIHLGASETVACKWPNDVLIGGKKAAGMLIETAFGGGDGVGHIIAGIGMNLLHSPKDALFPATSLKVSSGVTVPPQQALAVLADKVKVRLDDWDVNLFEPIRAEWQENAWGMGGRQTIRVQETEFQATLLGLTNEGGLETVLDSGEKQTIFAADIFPGLG